jgi:L-alanine-DL-glutamate epimerase-like enolase superfamily enzyme
MKITKIRSMKLWGPRNHGVGGGEAKIAKVVVRVDTDAGIYGLGEVDNFMGVAQGIAYMDEYFRGRDPFAANAVVSEMLFGTQAPNPAGVPRGPMGPQNIIACSMCSPTATPWGASPGGGASPPYVQPQRSTNGKLRRASDHPAGIGITCL